MRTNAFLIFIFIAVTIKSVAQDRYMIFFEDKANTPFDLEQPQAYLSDRAIERRERQGIEIIEEDLPVNPDYVDQVEASGAEVFFITKWLNGVLIQAEQGQIGKVGALPFVKNIERVARGVRLIKSSRVAEDEDTEGTEAAENDFQNSLLGISTLHAEGFKGEGMLIAFMDSGYEGVDVSPAFDHLFENDQVLIEKNFVINNDDIYSSEYRDHGTRVLSTVAAQLEEDYTGIAPNAEYLLFITEDLPTEYRIEEYNFLFAAEMADSAGVDVINTSLGYSFGFSDERMDYTPDQMDGQTAIITQAADRAFDKGILVVTSMGNEGANGNWSIMTAPADSPNVLSVGSINSDETRSSFSSVGPNAIGLLKPDLMALGSGTMVINRTGNVASTSGTSFSSPQIAGLATLYWQSEPELTNKQVFDNLLQLGNRFGNPNNDFGYGIPTFGRSITSIDVLDNALRIYPNPFSQTLIISSNERIRELKLYSLQGSLIHEVTGSGTDDYELQLGNLQNGIYMLKATFSNNTVVHSRVIKR